MPETLTDILTADLARKSRARQYENALGNLANVNRALERTTPERAAYAAQVALITKAVELIEDLDENIQGRGGYVAKDVILGNLQVALTDQQRRLDGCIARIATLTQERPRMEAALAEFTD